MYSHPTDDFTISFANVNGTGSRSANHMLAKALFRSGIPVAVQNIFPSNIQGMPTWYEIRIGGYAMRQGKAEIVVASNVRNLAEEAAEVQAGGYLLYDSSKFTELERSDINYIALPASDMCIKEFKDEMTFLLMRNMIFIGATVALIGAEMEPLLHLAREMYAQNEQMPENNRMALMLGYDYVRNNFGADFPFRLKKDKKNDGRIFASGNQAMALGTIYGGATVAAWYPITPASGLMERFVEYAETYRATSADGKKNYAVLQAEDELAAAGMVTGAGWAGARAFTATSGPGISLMSEFLGYAYFAEIPFVLFDIQRGGPSTGMPTRTQQADITACAYAGHGDTKNILLFPSDPHEAFEMAALSFDLAERLQTPIIVMSDLYLGANEHICEPFAWDDARRYDRGKILSDDDLQKLQGRYARYDDKDGDGIGERTYPGIGGGKGAYFTRGTSHNEFAEYSEKGADYVANIERLQRKWQSAHKFVPRAEVLHNGSASGIICFGSTARAVEEAAQVIACDLLRIKAFPFSANVGEFIASHEKLYVVEQNSNAQMKNLLVNELQIAPNKLHSILNFSGEAITADEIIKEVK